ncbi:MAG: hypothetical protein ACFE8M_13105 [Candidatus Hermodarchaeota archaeon]
MVQAVLEEKETMYCVKNEGIILEDLLISERKADVECYNEADSQKIDNINNYAKYHEEFIPINTVNRNVTFRNYGVY